MTFFLRHLNGLIFDCLTFTEVQLPLCSLWTVRPLPPVTPLSHLCGPSMLPGVEVSHPKTILKGFVTKRFFYVMMTTGLFIKYFSDTKLCCLWRFDDNMSVIYWEIICAKILFYIYCFRVWHLYSVNNRHVVIKSSQTTQLCIRKVFYKQSSCHHHIKKPFCNKSF
jgi:hypothetical protein